MRHKNFIIVSLSILYVLQQKSLYICKSFFFNFQLKDIHAKVFSPFKKKKKTHKKTQKNILNGMHFLSLCFVTCIVSIE